MKKISGYVGVSLALAFGGFWAATQVDLTTFDAGDVIRAEEVNDNFAQVETALDGKQERVDGSCAAGSAIRVVRADGTVACQAADGDGGGSGEPAAPAAVSVQNELQQEIPTNDETLVEFDVVEFEQGGELFSTAEPSRLVAPQDGLYAIDVQVGWRNEPDTGFLASRLYVNAAGSCSGGGTSNLADDVSEARANADAYHHLGMLKRLNAGDHVELCVTQGTGAQKFVEGFGETWATMRRVGPAE